MSQAKIEALTGSLKYAADAMVKAADSVSEDTRMKQLAEGKGHPLWLLGHTADALDLIVIQWILGGDGLLPSEYHKKFAPAQLGGEAITGDAADYPSWDDVLANYKQASAKAIEMISQLQDSELDTDPKNVPEQAKSFFGNLGQSLVGMVAHDSYHRGQIGLIAALPN